MSGRVLQRPRCLAVEVRAKAGRLRPSEAISSDLDEICRKTFRRPHDIPTAVVTWKDRMERLIRIEIKRERERERERGREGG